MATDNRPHAIELMGFADLLVALSHDHDDAWDELLRRDKVATDTAQKLTTLEAAVRDLRESIIAEDLGLSYVTGALSRMVPESGEGGA